MYVTTYITSSPDYCAQHRYAWDINNSKLALVGVTVELRERVKYLSVNLSKAQDCQAWLQLKVHKSKGAQVTWRGLERSCWK